MWHCESARVADERVEAGIAECSNYNRQPARELVSDIKLNYPIKNNQQQLPATGTTPLDTTGDNIQNKSH